MKLNLFKRKIYIIDRNEISGAFGDIGTTLPLLIGICISGNMDIKVVFIAFGIIQILTGFLYKIPMSVQPLKMIAMMVISNKVSFDLVMPAGLMCGILMLLLAITGILNKISKVFPLCVIRGMQLGVGISLATTSIKEYVLPSGYYGYVVSFICFIVGIFFIGNRRFPPAFFVLLIGLFYSFFFGLTSNEYFVNRFDNKKILYSLLYIPLTKENIINAFILLTIPQLSLSISNSILATRKAVNDLYPNISIDERKIGITYGMMNILNSILGGIPVCHGASGIIGHYSFGARTNRAIIIAGTLMILAGLLGGNTLRIITFIFPKSILGIILFLESILLMTYIKDCCSEETIKVILIVGILSSAFPLGYLIGILIGIFLYYVKIKPLSIFKRIEKKY